MNRQRWHKRGLLIEPPTGQPWARTHAALPVACSGERGLIDLYYSPRDGQGRAHIGLAELRAEPSAMLTAVDFEPDAVLSPGPIGAFDESGVTVSCVVELADATLLYYTGWTLGVTVPFYFYVGLAIRTRGARRFERVSAAPILERDAVDPYLTASPWVLCENGSWRMWYVSCVDWRVVDGEPRHRYHVRYAESEDGITWRRAGRVAIDFADEREYAMGRPCVVRDGDRYRMWFAARGEQYRLAYAESPDGLTWERDDSLIGLDLSAEGWDREMLAYPSILDHDGQRYLLYNGDGYGQTGIGYATQSATDE
ncbi:MAG TPA: hypothetical protein VGX69_07710 [Solirubrobacteraceae bacterium]|nr:hypothetical protein [Solirubrobacteraceae bacterium]